MMCKTCQGMGPSTWMSTCQSCIHVDSAGGCLNPDADPRWARTINVYRERNCLLHSKRPKTCPDCTEREPCKHCNDTGVRERSDGEIVGCGYCTVPTSDGGGGGKRPPTERDIIEAPFRVHITDLRRQNAALRTELAESKARVGELEIDLRRARENGRHLIKVGEANIRRADVLETENATLRARVGELEEVEVKHQSLLTELWSGVRVHGLNGNIGKRDGERLIHAYCGGIVTVMNELEEARIDLAKMTPVIQDVEYLWRFRHDDIAHLPEKFEEHDEQDFVDMLMDTFMAYQYAVEASKYEKS